MMILYGIGDGDRRDWLTQTYSSDAERMTSEVLAGLAVRHVALEKRSSVPPRVVPCLNACMLSSTPV
jgi:hypothetical protein